MPQRANVRTFDTSEVQGEGSYIMLRPMTLGEVLNAQRAAEERLTFWYRLARFFGRLVQRKPSPTEIARQNMADVISYVREWNWVDDDGQPLPFPSDDASVLFRLSMAEMRLITACVNGERQSEEQKN
jgi:hypothetical protein